MTLAFPRRRFLSLVGLGVAAAGVEVVAEPVRRIWQVGRNAPVGLSRDWVKRGAAWGAERVPLDQRFCEHTGQCFCNLPRRGFPRPRPVYEMTYAEPTPNPVDVTVYAREGVYAFKADEPGGFVVDL